jgi:carbon storage regulator
MLVLSRKKNEFIDIGSNISVVVVEIRGDKVRLGITAPENATVNRREITEAIRRQLAEGKPLREIEDRLDLKENCITHIIPAASLPPEHRSKT